MLAHSLLFLLPTAVLALRDAGYILWISRRFPGLCEHPGLILAPYISCPVSLSPCKINLGVRQQAPLPGKEPQDVVRRAPGQQNGRSELHVPEPGLEICVVILQRGTRKTAPCLHTVFHILTACHRLSLVRKFNKIPQTFIISHRLWYYKNKRYFQCCYFSFRVCF